MHILATTGSFLVLSIKYVNKKQIKAHVICVLRVCGYFLHLGLFTVGFRYVGCFQVWAGSFSFCITWQPCGRKHANGKRSGGDDHVRTDNLVDSIEVIARRSVLPPQTR